jgi:endothelin-converting enzyme
MLQPPYFHALYPDHINYAGIGDIAGHEITHAFDTVGRFYDYEGIQRDWWSKASSEAFDEKKQCFIEQYDKFTIVDPKGNAVAVNGKKTLQENIADNGGTRFAFATWKRSKQEGYNAMIPGLEKYSPEQMFFVAFASKYCSRTTPEVLLQRNEVNPHASDPARVNGVLQNMNEFREAFHCEAWKRMAPIKQCEIW